MSQVNKYLLEQMSFLDLIFTIKKSSKLIIMVMFYVSLTTMIVSFILPKTFTAKSVLMPPSTSSDQSISNMFGDSELPFTGLVSKTEEASMRLIAILKSRTVLEVIIEKYDLLTFYKSENIEEALESLENFISFEINEEGTITIEVSVLTGWLHYHNDEVYARELSAKIANEFVMQLDVVNKKLQIEHASHQRKFLGERYDKNIKDLKIAENNLKEYKQLNNIISIEDQKKTAIESAAALKNQIIINEVQIEVVSSKLQSDHPDAIAMKDELAELKKKLDEIKFGKNQDTNITNNLFLVLSDIPNMEASLRHLNREVEIYNTLFVYLTQQYEDAKIQEARNTPTVQLLDEAIIPITKTAPKRFLMLVVMNLIALIGSSVYVLFIENYKSL